MHEAFIETHKLLLHISDFLTLLNLVWIFILCVSNDFSLLKSLLSLAKIDNLEQNFILVNTEISIEVSQY